MTALDVALSPARTDLDADRWARVILADLAAFRAEVNAQLDRLTATDDPATQRWDR